MQISSNQMLEKSESKQKKAQNTIHIHTHTNNRCYSMNEKPSKGKNPIVLGSMMWGLQRHESFINYIKINKEYNQVFSCDANGNLNLFLFLFVFFVL